MEPGAAMIHLVLLFYLIALGIGCFSLGISVHLFVAFRHKTLRYFIPFLASLLTALFSLLVRTYAALPGSGPPGFFAGLSLVVMSAGNFLYIAVAPFFYHALVGRPVAPPVKIASLAVDFGLGTAAVVYVVFRPPFVLYGLLIPSLFVMLAYGIVLILANLRNVGDPALRRGLRVFCVVSALFLPLLALDAVYDRLPALAPLRPFGLLTLPAWFIAVNLLCIFFAEGRFNHPVYWENEGPSGFFMKKFDITERERDIIGLMMRGESNQAMGEKLFISPKTVENHVYSIYQKTGVKNRVQLCNLIRTNF
jgi:DNA-binding CsgD family transcriptional regulator